MGEDILRGLRREHHLAAVGLDLAGIADRRVGAGGVLQRRLIDGELHQTVAVEIQRHLFATDQVDPAGAGDDHTLVADRITRQRDRTAASRLDDTLVHHRAIARTGIQFVLACHEIVDADAGTGGDQATHVDPGAGAEQDAVGVHQEDLAVGLDLPVDLAGVLVEDPVQRGRRLSRLLELHQFIGSDVERLPIDGEILRILGNDGRVGVRIGDGTAAGDDLAALWPGKYQSGVHAEEHAGR